MIAKIKIESGKVVAVKGHNSAVPDILRFIDEWNSDSESIVAKTSGSTGKPKDILLQKKEMIASAQRTGEYFSVNRPLNAWHALPMSFIAGKMMVVRALQFDWQLLVSEPTACPELPHEKPGFAALTPLQFSQLIDNGMNVDFSELTILGGGEVTSSLMEKIGNASSKIYSTYGMTETITHIAACLLSESEPFLYHALPGVTFQSDDRGCLIIEASHLSNSPIVTNDQVELVSSFAFKFRGRADRVINSGGLKIQPEEIEKVLEQRFEFNFFVDGVDDPVLGKKAVLFIEEKNRDRMEELKQFISDHFEKKLAPKEIRVLPEFHYTHTGKLIKRNP